MQTMTIGEPVTQPWTADSPAGTNDPKTTELVELMLKDRRRLDALIREDSHAPELIPRLLAVALHGIHDLRNRRHADPEPGAALPRVGASGAMVRRHLGKPDPGLRAGPGRGHGRLPAELLLLRAARRRQAVDAPVGRARGEVPRSHAVVLVGAVPIYVAVSLGMIVFSAPAEWLRLTITLGLAMPFVAGLWGVRTLFLGFSGSGRYAAGVSQGRAGVFPAPPDRGLGCLLHGGHARS